MLDKLFYRVLVLLLMAAVRVARMHWPNATLAILDDARGDAKWPQPTHKGKSYAFNRNLELEEVKPQSLEEQTDKWLRRFGRRTF